MSETLYQSVYHLLPIEEVVGFPVSMPLTYLTWDDTDDMTVEEFNFLESISDDSYAVWNEMSIGNMVYLVKTSPPKLKDHFMNIWKGWVNYRKKQMKGLDVALLELYRMSQKQSRQ
jgi:hypothetical protein